MNETIKVWYIENNLPKYLYDGEEVIENSELTQEDCQDIFDNLVKSLELVGVYAHDNFGVKDAFMGFIFRSNTCENLEDKLFIFARNFIDVIVMYKEYTLAHDESKEPFAETNDTFMITYPNYKFGIGHFLLMMMRDMYDASKVEWSAFEKSFMRLVTGKIPEQSIGRYLTILKSIVTLENTSDEFTTQCHIFETIIDLIYEEKLYNDRNDDEGGRNNDR